MNMTPEQDPDDQVDRYVGGKLSEDERSQFEIRMMDDPRLFTKVQMTQALKTGLREHADLLLGTTAAHSPQQRSDTTSSKIVPFRLWLRQPLSLAASLLVAVMGLQLWLQGNRDITADSDRGATAISTLLILENTRGDSLPEFRGAPPYLLQIDAGVENGSRAMTVDLIDTSTNAQPTHINAVADADGWIRLLVTSELPERFDVVLSAQPGVTSQRYTARLTR